MNPVCESCGAELDPERGHVAPVCDDECAYNLNQPTDEGASMQPTYDEVKRANHIGAIYSLVGCEVPNLAERVKHARQISENNESKHYAELFESVYGLDYAVDSFLCVSYLREWVGKLVTAIGREQVRQMMDMYPNHVSLGPVHRLFFMLADYQNHQRNGGAA